MFSFIGEFPSNGQPAVRNEGGLGGKCPKPYPVIINSRIKSNLANALVWALTRR